jgi:hypothetical protein
MERKTNAELMEGIPPRTWVALSADETRVVGTGASYGEAVDRAVEQGEKDAILLMTPPSDGIQVFF